MFKFEDLRVYQEGQILVDEIYLITESWPKGEIFGLTSQFRRAVVSIVLNIAEGSSRTKKDFKHFLDISIGSCYECVAVLAIAKKRGYISEEEDVAIYERCERLSKMLSALKNSIN